MSSIGTNIAQSVAGAQGAERVQARANEKKEAERTRRQRALADQAILDVDAVERANAERDLKGNADEETRDDRTASGHYTRSGVDRKKPPHIDVEG